MTAVMAQVSTAPMPKTARPSASFRAPPTNRPLPLKWREPEPNATQDAIDASIAVMPRPQHVLNEPDEERSGGRQIAVRRNPAGNAVADDDRQSAEQECQPGRDADPGWRAIREMRIAERAQREQHDERAQRAEEHAHDDGATR